MRISIQGTHFNVSNENLVKLNQVLAESMVLREKYNDSTGKYEFIPQPEKKVQLEVMETVEFRSIVEKTSE